MAPTKTIPPHFDLTVGIGCRLAYQVPGTAALCLNVKPRTRAAITPSFSRR